MKIGHSRNQHYNLKIDQLANSDTSEFVDMGVRGEQNPIKPLSTHGDPLPPLVVSQKLVVLQSKSLVGIQ